MGIAVDDSTIARWAGTPADGVAMNSGTFIAPSNSVLVVEVNCDTNSGAGGVTIACSGGGLTWSQRVERDTGSGGTLEGHASIHRAVVGAGGSMSIDVTRTGANAFRVSAKAYIVTGADVNSPDGQTAAGNSTTDNISPSLTTLGAGRLFGGATDWNQTASDPSSTDTEDAAHYSGTISCLSVYKAADHAAGTSQSINFDSIGASPQWSYVLYEVLAASVGSVFPKRGRPFPTKPGASRLRDRFS